jgi:hypothetical protein
MMAKQAMPVGTVHANDEPVPQLVTSGTLSKKIYRVRILNGNGSALEIGAYHHEGTALHMAQEYGGVLTEETVIADFSAGREAD